MGRPRRTVGLAGTLLVLAASTASAQAPSASAQQPGFVTVLAGDAVGAGAVAGAADGAGAATAGMSRREYFAYLDREPALRRLAERDALAALLALVARADVPPAVDRAYAAKAGTPGGGRVLLALDYTRGMDTEPTWAEALADGPKRVIAAKVLTPLLTHFRAVDGVPLFRGDVGFVPAFRDSHLTAPTTNQVGHLLCAVESGWRQGRYSRRPFARRVYELGLRVAARLFGLRGVQPTIADWSRAGIIGHEMVGDEDGSGFLGQMNAYGRLVAGGDPAGVRAAWDAAVAASLAGDHAAAWRAVRTIAAAAQVPETAADIARNRLDPAPRFAAPGAARGGNSLADLALSAYGFALGQRAAAAGYPTPAAARAELEAFLAARGAPAAAIDAAAEATRGR